METISYMTKTQFIRRSDTRAREDTYLIAMDIGYSSVKVLSENIAGIFPSFAIPDTGMGTAGTLTDDYIRYEDLETGEKWFVGKMALDTISDDDTSVSGSSLYRRDRYNDPMFKVLARTGLGVACIFDRKEKYKERKICLETGLPPRYITKGAYDVEAMTELLSGTHKFALQIGQKEPVRFELTIGTDMIHIMPQPMGTLFSAAVGSNHAMLPIAQSLLNKNVLIFDGGFGTLDLYPIKSHVIQPSETYDNLGMKRVLEETADVIREKFHKDISVPAMQKYLKKGAFRWFEQKSFTTKDEPLADILEICSNRICDEALEKTFQVYHVYEYDYLIITGGTGAAWFDRIKEKLKNMSTLTVMSGSQSDNLPAVFSNVRGYYMFRYGDLASRR